MSSQPTFRLLREVQAWADSGLMALSGWPSGPPLAPPFGVVGGLDAVVEAIGDRSADLGTRVELRWEPLVTGRAAILGLHRQGRISAGGSCRLLSTTDGWAAVNLARPDDVAAVAAVVGGPVGDDPWIALDTAAAASTSADFVNRARLLGLPAASLAPPPAGVGAWTSRRVWPRLARRPVSALRVVDLSAMWAGPLAAMILASAGAEVIKVESASRPDGARAVPAFYRWLHAPGQTDIVLDLARPSGRRRLRALVDEADVVIESSRPRALEQLGAGPRSLSPRPGRVWLSISGYGRDDPAGTWVAFGDDAAVAGGLVAWDSRGEPVFCGDAIADPITGLSAARAVLDALADGGGCLIDVAMSRCVASLVDRRRWGHAPPVEVRRPAPGGGWEVDVGGSVFAVAGPESPERADGIGSGARR